MPKPKWWILNLKGEWNLINPQPSLDEDEFDVAFKLWVNESNVKLSYFKPWRITRPDKIWYSEIGLFGVITVHTSHGFYIQYDPTTLEIIGHKGELPAFYNQYDFYYELTDVPVDTLTLTLDAAKKFQEKGLLKLVKSYHRRKFKGKCKQKL